MKAVAKTSEIDFRANLKNVKSNKFKLGEEEEVRFKDLYLLINIPSNNFLDLKTGCLFKKHLKLPKKLPGIDFKGFVSL